MVANESNREAGSTVSGAGAKAGRSSLRLDKPKTLFVIVDTGMAIRNILRTDVFEVLRSCENLRIVVFSPITDAQFKQEIAGKNVFVEPLQNWRPRPLVKTLRSIRKDIWAEKHELVRFREKRSSRKNQFARGLLLSWLRRGRSSGRIERWLERLERWEARSTPSLGAEYFDKYKPDLVFYTTIYSRDLALEIGAQQRGIPSLAFILSWDNPTTKGPFQVRPDHVIVWNNIMRHEVIQHHSFPAEGIFVAGPPQFDIYTDRRPYISREQFFKRWDLDPSRKLITYTTGTPVMLPLEHEVIEMLYQKMQAGAFRQPCQMLVRLHPKDIYDVYKRFENWPGLRLQLPGRTGRTDDSWNPTREDMYGLAELMCYSDVVVNVASTITIDAAALDRPVVNVAFDGFQTLPYEKSCRRYYDFDHYKRIVQTKGIRMAYNLEETVQAIQAYLDDPTLEAAGRARIREEQCYRTDGKSGERIAHHIIKLLR